MGSGSCHLWDVMNDGWGGGLVLERVVTPILTHAVTRRVGGREKGKKTDKRRVVARCGGRKKVQGKNNNKNKTKKQKNKNVG